MRLHLRRPIASIIIGKRSLESHPPPVRPTLSRTTVDAPGQSDNIIYSLSAAAAVCSVNILGHVAASTPPAARRQKFPNNRFQFSTAAVIIRFFEKHADSRKQHRSRSRVTRSVRIRRGDSGVYRN